MSQSLSTSSARIAAIRLKSANKYIFRALLSLASAALLVRVTGMLNQLVVSSHYGAGAMMDAYFVALTLPTLLTQLVGSAVEASVIPVYARVRARGDREQSARLFSTLFNLLLLGSALLTVVMLLFHRQLVLFAAPALDPYRANLASSLAPFMYPIVLLMIMIGYLECILNTEGQFGWPAYAGLLVPLTTAAFVLIIGTSFGVLALCIGMVAGLCLQLGAFIIRARRAKLAYRFVIDLHHPELGVIMAAAWPVLLGSLMSHASPLVDQMFASFLSAGSISALSYALKLNSVPVGVVFDSVGRAALPYLARQAGAGDMRSFKTTLRLYLWVVGGCTLVLSAGMFILARPIVQVLFQHGAFTASDTLQTASVLQGFAIGLTPMSIGYITSRAFSAMGKTKVLMRVTMFSVTANALFDALFAHFWQAHGIALATSAVFMCTMSILLFTLRRTIGRLDLLVLPPELRELAYKLCHEYLPGWFLQGGDGMFAGMGAYLGRAGIIIAVFAAGVVGVLLNSLTTLRIALGSVVILALMRYRYGLLLIWVLLNIFIGATLPFFNGNNFLSGLSVSTLLLLTCAPLRQIFARLPTLGVLLLYLFWVLVGISLSPLGAGTFLVTWLTFVDYLAVAILTIQVVNTPQRLARLIDAILLLAVVVSLYGIFGYITRQNGIPDPTSALFFRIGSVFGKGPQSLALFLSIVIPLAVYRACWLRSWRRVLVLFCALLLLATLALTFTRAAYVCVLLSFVIMALKFSSRRLKRGIFQGLLLLGASIVLLALVGNVPLFGRFLSEDVLTLNGRIYLWQALLRHFNPTQVFGNGLGASQSLLLNLQVSDSRGVIGAAPHDLFLGTLYDNGVIGFVLLVAVFASIAKWLFRGMRETFGARQMLFVTTFAIFVSVLLQSLETSDIWSQGIGIYFWIVMALPFAFCWQEPPVAIVERQPDAAAAVMTERERGRVLVSAYAPGKE